MKFDIKRRNLLKVGGAVALTLGAKEVIAKNEAKNEVFNWKMVMSWPKKFPGLGTTAEWFANELQRVSNGRINITIYGAGELVPAFEVLNAVSDGTAQLGHGTPYYWKGKIPEAEFFTSVPFGMTPYETLAWYEHGGGEELLNEMYQPFGINSVICGNTDFQMGGWFNKEINSLNDLKGLKIRMPGIGGEVLKRAGATPVGMPGSEIFTSMQSGVLDAADWVGPWNDQAFGLFKVAKYYYGGWQEPGSIIETLINKDAFASLPEDLRALVKLVAKASGQQMMADCRANNARSLQAMLNEQGVELRVFPQDVIVELKKQTAIYLQQFATKSDFAAKLLRSYQDFQQMQEKWAENERNFLNYRNL